MKRRRKRKRKKWKEERKKRKNEKRKERRREEKGKGKKMHLIPSPSSFHHFLFPFPLWRTKEWNRKNSLSLPLSFSLSLSHSLNLGILREKRYEKTERRNMKGKREIITKPRKWESRNHCQTQRHSTVFSLSLSFLLSLSLLHVLPLFQRERERERKRGISSQPSCKSHRWYSLPSSVNRKPSIHYIVMQGFCYVLSFFLSFPLSLFLLSLSLSVRWKKKVEKENHSKRKSLTMRKSEGESATKREGWDSLTIQKKVENEGKENSWNRKSTRWRKRCESRKGEETLSLSLSLSFSLTIRVPQNWLPATLSNILS